MHESRLRRDEGKLQESANLARQAMVRFDGAEAAGYAEARSALNGASIELAEILRRDSRLDEAAALAAAVAEEVEKRAPGTDEHVAAIFMQGRILHAQGDLESAEPLLRRAYDLQARLSGQFSHPTNEVRNGLAELLSTRGKTAEAETLLRQNVEAVRRIHGEASPALGVAWNNLANATSDIPEKYGEAEQEYLEAIRIFQGALEPGHPEIANSYNNLGALYIKTQQWDRALEVQQIALGIRAEALGPDHPNTAASRMGVALALNRLGQGEAAEATMREVISSLTKSLGPTHWRTANARLQLGLILRDHGRAEEAQAEIRPAHAIMVAELGSDHPRTLSATKALAELEGTINGPARSSP
jgi:tetratricopeptide (TPR) repeat protein